METESSSYNQIYQRPMNCFGPAFSHYEMMLLIVYTMLQLLPSYDINTTLLAGWLIPLLKAQQ